MVNRDKKLFYCLLDEYSAVVTGSKGLPNFHIISESMNKNKIKEIMMDLKQHSSNDKIMMVKDYPVNNDVVKTALAEYFRCSIDNICIKDDFSCKLDSKYEKHVVNISDELIIFASKQKHENWIPVIEVNDEMITPMKGTYYDVNLYIYLTTSSNPPVKIEIGTCDYIVEKYKMFNEKGKNIWKTEISIIVKSFKIQLQK